MCRLARFEEAGGPRSKGAIAFQTAGTLMRLPVEGGEPVFVADVPFATTRASWGEDDTIVLSRFGFNGQGLWMVPASGGAPRELTFLDADRGDLMHHLAAHLPGGRGLLYTALFPERVILRESDTGAERALTDGSLPRERLLQNGGRSSHKNGAPPPRGLAERPESASDTPPTARRHGASPPAAVGEPPGARHLN